MGAVVLALAVVAGCGSTASGEQPATAPAAGEPAKTSNRQQIESIKADCMKQQGFKYVSEPFTLKESDAETKVRNGDYEAMKEERSKQGFGVFIVLAGGTRESEAPPDGPNDKYMSNLNDAQYKAYVKADNACYAKGVKQILGKTIKTRGDLLKQAKEYKKQLATRELDGDPELVTLADAMADCLKGKGHRVGATNPGAVARNGFVNFSAIHLKVVKDGAGADSGAPAMTPAQAKPYLEREIKAALEDLECGKDFYAAYAPKDDAINRRFLAEFGLSA
ncbi:hypothetical protein GCM10009560_67600 [Nonomuraea longicatena]|uniref:Lipoprotein n=2 Tax=Nonomuraea longicatena TaxID=83682 RepID=A0ABN1QYQ2_9ACTN